MPQDASDKAHGRLPDTWHKPQNHMPALQPLATATGRTDSFHDMLLGRIRTYGRTHDCLSVLFTSRISDGCGNKLDIRIYRYIYCITHHA